LQNATLREQFSKQIFTNLSTSKRGRDVEVRAGDVYFKQDNCQPLKNLATMTKLAIDYERKKE